MSDRRGIARRTALNSDRSRGGISEKQAVLAFSSRWGQDESTYGLRVCFPSYARALERFAVRKSAQVRDRRCAADGRRLSRAIISLASPGLVHLGKRETHTQAPGHRYQRSGTTSLGPAMAPWPLTWILGPPPAASASESADASGASSASSPPRTAAATGQQASPASTTVTKHVQSPGGKTDPDADAAGTEAQTALASWAALLEPFKAGSGRLPEKARTDPSIRQRIEAPVAHLWEYVPFFAKQGQSPRQPFSIHT